MNNEEIGDVIISNRRIDESEILKRIEKNLVAYTITDNSQQATSGPSPQVTNSLNATLNQENAEVKSLSKISTNPQVYTDSFKTWFGDWQNNPAAASKAVNPDGTPLVLYHGSPIRDIQIFRPQGATNGGEGLTYATDVRDVAEGFSLEFVPGSSAFRNRPTGNAGETYPIHPLLRYVDDTMKAGKIPISCQLALGLPASGSNVIRKSDIVNGNAQPRPVFETGTNPYAAEAQRQYDEVVAKYKGTDEGPQKPKK